MSGNGLLFMSRSSIGPQPHISRCARSLAAGLVTLSVTTTAFAEVNRPAPELLVRDPFAAMEQFARCAARFDLAAALHDQEGKPVSAEEYRGGARGALAVAQFFAMNLAAEPMIENPENSDPLKPRMSQIESFYEVETVKQGALAERGGFDEDGFRYCFDIQPLQIRTIEAMQRAGLF